MLFIPGLIIGFIIGMGCDQYIYAKLNKDTQDISRDY